MSGNKWWSRKVGPKLLSDLVMFSIFSFIRYIPLDFSESIRVVLLKYLMYFLAGINTKYFWNIPEENYFGPLTILNSFIKSSVNCFVDIAVELFLVVHWIHFYLTFLVYYQNPTFYEISNITSACLIYLLQSCSKIFWC